MERRREPRFPAGCQAEIHILGRDPATLTGRIEDVSGRGMRLRLDRPVPPDTAILVKLHDAAILGEVCYAQPLVHGYAVGLLLDQVLYQSPELEALSRSLGYSPAAQPQSAHPPVRPPNP